MYDNQGSLSAQALATDGDAKAGIAAVSRLYLLGNEGQRVDLAAGSGIPNDPTRTGAASVSVGNGKVSAVVESTGQMVRFDLAHLANEAGVIDTTRGTARLSLVDGAPSLTLAEKFYGHPSAVLGRSELANTRTGVETKRPASSLVLFDKEGKVLWKAP